MASSPEPLNCLEATESPNPQAASVIEDNLPAPKSGDDMCTCLESDSTWSEPIKLELHGDHSDRIYTFNPWQQPPNGDLAWEDGWPFETILHDAKSCLSNAQLDENEQTQTWLKTLQSLSRGKVSRGPRGVAIPLFDAENGDEYRLVLDSRGTLPERYCPERLKGSAHNVHMDSIYQLEPRLSLDESSGNDKLSIPIPKLCRTIGTLNVRTKLRRTQNPDQYSLDLTEYDVVVDIGHKEMPLWIIASRPCLQLRATGLWWGPFPPSLPIFDGLMATDDGGHDIACILPSIRDLTSCGPEGRLATYKKCVELVRYTRATVDPVNAAMHRDEVEEWFKREPDDWPIKPPSPPYFSTVWDRLEAIRKYFTWDA